MWNYNHNHNYNYNYNYNKNHVYGPELYHHGVKGMKWGVRRYQNPDGSLTSAGRKRYGGLLGAYAFGGDVTTSVLNAGSKRLPGRGLKTVGRVATSYSQGVADKFGNAHETKGLIGKTRQLYGNASIATHRRALSEGFKEASDLQKSGSLSKSFMKSASENNASLAEYHQQQHDYGINVGKRFVGGTVGAFNVPYRTISGRQTTRGKQAVSMLLTGGAYQLAVDGGRIVTKQHKKYAK